MPVPIEKQTLTDSTRGYLLMAIHIKLATWGLTDKSKKVLYRIYGVDSLSKVETKDLREVSENLATREQFIKFLKLKAVNLNDGTKR